MHERPAAMAPASSGPPTPRTETQLLDFDALDALQPQQPSPRADQQGRRCGAVAAEQSNGWVLLRPVNGLCNRLSAIVAGALLARDLGRRLVVDWRCTPVCNCPWDRLVLPSEDVILVTEQLLKQEPALLGGMKLLETVHPSIDQEHFASAMARKTFMPLRLPYCGQACWLDTEASEWRRLDRLDCVEEDELPAAAQLPCMVVLAFDEFYPPREESRRSMEAERSALLGSLRPVPAVARLVRKLPTGTVGVHVRRSDHESAKKHSPDSLFVDAMDGLGAETGGRPCHFFLATDDPAVEELLKRRFGSRLRSLPKRTLDRKAPEGIGGAFADLLSLAQCERIIGSYESTFSRIAALYRRVPLTVLYQA